MKIYILLIILTLLATRASGQLTVPGHYNRMEVFAGAGTTHYFGDIGGKSGTYEGLAVLIDNFGIDLWQTRMGVSGGFRYQFLRSMAVSSDLSGLWLSGNDRNSMYAYRGLAFNTLVLQGSAVYEYYLARRSTGLAPYTALGGAASLYRLKKKDHPWHRLLYTPALVIRLGTRFPTRSRITQSLEVGFSYYFSDFLDGWTRSTKNVGDTGYFIRYVVNIEMARNFLYDHRGLIRR